MAAPRHVLTLSPAGPAELLRPLRANDLPDAPFRQGLFRIATATSRTEIAWLREMLTSLAR
ncbi:hypothetical protein AB0B94_07545 [Micromonospora sp. NPDC048986]|uniref:hypothetical protein n=1 Tax=Micromonospora sp. NPDC048986 TaxID=3155644 RepID=UPI0033D2BA74